MRVEAYAKERYKKVMLQVHISYATIRKVIHTDVDFYFRYKIFFDCDNSSTYHREYRH